MGWKISIQCHSCRRSCRPFSVGTESVALFLFGSYGKGTATEKSDVDLLVDSGLRGLKFVGFLDEVQRTVGKEVDLFDVSHIQAGSQIEREIKDTGITVYEK